MKPINLLSSVFALGLATTVTAGTMYVTAKAAVQQEQDGLGAALAPSTETSAPAGVPAIPEMPETMPSLAPEEIRHDRQHHIVIDAQGSFTGRLSSLSSTDAVPASGYTVKIMQHGAEVAVTTTDAGGNFGFSGLNPGVSGIIALNDSGIMLFSARLVQAEPGAAVPVAVTFGMDSAVVSASDVKLARELISSALSTEEVRFTDEAGPDEESFHFGAGEKSTSLVGHHVQLDADGNLRGVVNVLDERTGRHREVLDMTVHFLRDGKVVGSTDVAPNGDFVVAGLNPGIHSVVGVGKDGVFAIGVDVLGSSYDPEQKTEEATPVSVRVSLQLTIAPVRAANLNSLNTDKVTNNTVPSPSPTTEMALMPTSPGAGGGFPGTGGGGGSMGGGGGGIGGGGGLGGLLGAAAGGALGYALGRDDASPGN